MAAGGAHATRGVRAWDRRYQERQEPEPVRWAVPTPIPALLLRQWSLDSQTSQQWRRLVETTSASSELARRSGLTRRRIRQIRQPVLAVFGEHSSCLPTLRGLEQSLPHIRKVVLPGVGHVLPIFQPEIFARTFTEFVRELESPA